VIFVVITMMMMRPTPSSDNHRDSPWEARLRAITDMLPTSPTEEELEAANTVLHEMIVILQQQKNIDRPPKNKPPAHDMFPDNDHAAAPTNLRSLVPSQAVVASTSAASHNFIKNNKNPFATFRQYMDDDTSSDEDDEDDDEAGSEEDHNTRTHSPPADDIPFPLRAAMSQQHPPAMDARRLLIRLYDAHSSIHAALAVHCRKRLAWLDGAEHFQRCIMYIQSGLVLADSAISKYFVDGRNPDPLRLQLLQEDANIIEVAVQSMARNRDKYEKLAQQQANYLVRKLTPQWKSRDDVKERMGDNWYRNPHPRGDYAKQRAELEDQLKIVNAALAALQNLEVNQIQHVTQGLLQKLSNGGRGGNPMNGGGGNGVDHAAERRRRYNGQRPLDTSQRVSWNDYPDATEFGWTFTGSHEESRVEFFERDGIIKLDWYYTTATVKTSLDHPKQGRTQLFASQVTPELYLQILLEPRAHTGQRYHTKATKPSNNNKKKNR
jgi:hypothetical protein